MTNGATEYHAGEAGVTILAFDTACDACSVAVWRAGGALAHRFQPMTRGQSEALVPMIAGCMTDAGTGFADLAAVAVTVGPGAFTGLRIGLATARAIALAAGCRAVGVTTLAALAAAVPCEPAATLVAVVDAKRDDLYAQSFAVSGGRWQALGAPAAVLPATLARALPPGPVLLAGDGAVRLLAALAPADAARVAVTDARQPDARQVAALAAAELARGAPSPPRPLYLRPPDASLPTANRRRPA